MRKIHLTTLTKYTVIASIVLVFSTILGEATAQVYAEATCSTWVGCTVLENGGWIKLAHVLTTGVAAIFVLMIILTAWRDHRSDSRLLPLSAVLSVLFIGQSMIGGIQVLRKFPLHLQVLHTIGALMLWISLLALIFASSQVNDQSKKNHHEYERLISSNLKQRIKDFFTLTKPLIVLLLLLTTFAGLAAGGRQWPEPSLLLWTMVGGALAAGGASALNQYIDRELDRKMQRTSRRPLAEGRLTAAEGLAFGLILCLASYYVMAGFVNLLAALLSLSGIIYYVLFYSIWLKKATVQNIVIGGGAGAIPPLVGWAAATGHLSLEAWILFFIVFFWTPPHFWALAIVRKKDYEKAGVPMLPVVRGEKETRSKIFMYTIELVAVTLLLPIFNLTGIVYLLAATLLGAGLIYAAWKVWKFGGNLAAWKMYRWSSMYLAFIFAAIVVDAVL
jgi:protoheme IX farnesyltransferase